VCGVSYELFWGDITPKLLQKYTQAYNRRLQDLDSLHHLLGNYIAIGVNNPKKYPKEPYLTEKKQIALKEMSDDQMQQEAKRIAIMFGGEVK